VAVSAADVALQTQERQFLKDHVRGQTREFDERIDVHRFHSQVREDLPLAIGHAVQRRGEHGRVAARKRVFVMGSRENMHVLEIALLNRSQKLITTRHLLQAMLRYAQREIDDLALPNVDSPVQSADDDFDYAAALRPEYVRGVKANARGQRQNNVGDSRAYLLRNNSVRQISQDHSWVAEQVRAGLLSEEQARTHAQRNVITRCLGTQADVDIDIFSEELEQGDSLILCTDGLSGLVSDEELQRIVNQYVPQESVYHLVDRLL